VNRATFRAAADKAVEEQMKAQEAWIEQTGDVTDPGELGMLVTALDCLATGDDELAAEILMAIAVSLRQGDEAEAKEAFRDLNTPGLRPE
jgi:hypothetical protein